MLFRKSLIRELSRSATAIFSILMLILVVTQLVKLLGKASSGEFPFEAALTLLGFACLRYAPILLILTLFLSVLIVLSRWYRDQEMTIWLGSGLKIVDFIRPVLTFSLPFVAAIVVLSLWLGPQAERAMRFYREVAKQEQQSRLITAGVFQVSRDGAQVAYVESYSREDAKAQHVFLQFNQEGERGFILAKQGKIEQSPSGSAFFNLTGGTLYQMPRTATQIEAASEADRMTQNQQGWRALLFEALRIRLRFSAINILETNESSLSPQDLARVHSAPAYAEWAWRISMPIAALLLPLLALLLSKQKPRAGRAGNLIVALLVYLLYYNCIGIIEQAIKKAQIPPLSMTGVHLALCVVIVVLCAQQLGWRWKKIVPPCPCTKKDAV